MNFKVIPALSAALVSGCAQFSNEIVPARVSHNTYASYSCTQLKQEHARVNASLATYAGEQDKIANRDTGLALASVFVVTAPAVYFMSGGNGPIADEIAYLRGQSEAIESVSIQKNCRLRTAS